MSDTKKYEVQVMAELSVTIVCNVEAISMGIAENKAISKLYGELQITTASEDIGLTFDISTVDALVIDVED